MRKELAQKIYQNKNTRVMDDGVEGNPTEVILFFESGEAPCAVAVHDGDLPEHSRLNSVMRFRAVTAYMQRAYPGTMFTVSPLGNWWFSVRLDSGAKHVMKRIRAVLTEAE